MTQLVHTAGSGKSTIVNELTEELERSGLRTVHFSLDDLYLTHREQLELSAKHPANKLYKHRGLSGTHDMVLAKDIFQQLRESWNAPAHSHIDIPVYDKSLHSGQGDRKAKGEWRSINLQPSNPIRVVIFEGWSVGFRPLEPAVLSAQHKSATHSEPSLTNQLAEHSLQDVLDINSALRDYDTFFSGPQFFDGLVYLQTLELGYVYDWRQQQEQGLRDANKPHQSEEGIINFVKNYMIAYELYLPQLTQGFFGSQNKGRQLTLTLNKQREMMGSQVI
ncbi:hypothetical protein E3P96_02673 [Wallemia ichthyophaga]|nr:hypothetical protein E3P96_02673 [Wallemia ichthyophaga]